MWQILKKKLIFWSSACLALFIVGAIVILQVFLYYGKDLPDYHQLENYDPPAITRLYTNDGRVLEEIATENRIYVKYNEIPEVVINAFIAAEDKNFFKHEGVDLFSIARAAFNNVLQLGKHKNLVGGSTITQQVVKNFLLSNEQSLARKIKEAILAYRISNVYSKEKVMELYLNQIFLGNNSYGILSASINYFNKQLDELNVEEAAMLAAMPKSPSYINPMRNYERSKQRRDWVLSRMYEEGFITSEELHRAANTIIALRKRYQTDFFHADYYAEAVRKELIEKFGENHVYNSGLQVHTNLDERLQVAAQAALIKGIRSYDKAHGWRGAIGNIDISKENWLEQFKKFPIPLDILEFKLAIVTQVENKSANITLQDESKGVIKIENSTWLKKHLPNQQIGPRFTNLKQALKNGDIIVVNHLKDAIYTLEQIPEVNGAIVAMETMTGRVLAHVGGYSYKKSNFDRVLQADRQPGSAFKTFVYLNAFERGWRPNDIIHDDPITISQGAGMPSWTPRNYSRDYLGPITLRRGLEKSRNLCTVRLLLNTGIDSLIELSERLGIYRNVARNLSMGLGAAETTVMRLANAYNIIASGGRLVSPNLIERVYDHKGNLIYSSENRTASFAKSLNTELLPKLEYNYEQLIDPQINYQLLSILEGAVIRGTAARAREIGKTLAGKTGTTNESFDTWFAGSSPDITATIYVGFDNPKTLGNRAEGANIALPIFIDFMKEALKDIDSRPFPVPEGISFAEVDINTGNPPTEETERRYIALEAFRSSNNDGVLSMWKGDSVPNRDEETENILNQGFGSMY